MEAEKPAGEWNTLEATFFGPIATIYLYGELVQEAIDLPGRIRLEPEGALIQFRNLRVTELPAPPPPPPAPPRARGDGAAAGAGGRPAGAD